MSAPRLLVFGDSLSFHGPDGPHRADEPRLWPNVAATALGGTADVVAQIGWTARDMWWALINDPRVWAELHRADVVVLAVGSMDTLPSPLPTYLRTGLRYLRPDRLRRVARRAYLAAQPRLAVALRGRPTVLPARLTVRYLDTAVGALRTLRPTLPVVGWLPSVHQAPSYGYVHTAHPAATAAVAAWGRGVGVPLLDLPAVVGEHVRGGRGNPDGMHWGWAGHAAVGAAMAELIGPLLPAADDPGP
ncbi:GDSL-like Lipase/Acylhydrolase family protein [Amycolatopsis arida]|uniref:GDSL-like Lipase/Acylhydrolase family protein n=1 Tax=Amycolatopsis arida TaxID=587909 RepID=A0A1I5UTP7_9PSEU|nr:diglucosylglycerate octanoyltransferase [Amycolatopsis arida]TDX91028.1 GDSL-like lipase/acylhydrolase family protein [Amycolatopsis arida]SFP98570.1 GDSL-like Lipase/Acylhydrolase family protein [Amycolatopsis arida]